MPTFGNRSKSNLMQLHPQLQRVANAAIATIDFTIICGYRGEYDQNKAFAEGMSKAKFGQSPHNFLASAAFDFIPFPFNGWDDRAGFIRVAKTIVACGKSMNIPVRSGSDWNMDGNFNNDKFIDTPHIELHPWRMFVKQ